MLAFRSNHGRRVGAVLCGCALALLSGTGTAGAETLFFSPGPQQAFVVPSGVTHIKVTAIGEKGQDLCLFGKCFQGFGEKVVATLAVKPGQTLYADFVGAGAGTGVGAGRGGNAADLRTIPSAEAGSLASRVIVAGGGGGEGEVEEGSTPGMGGNAGSTEGQAGDPSKPAGGGAVSGGGGGGTQSAGGAGGTGASGGAAGAAGQLGQGGNGGGGSPAGGAGGGGGGYYGGGGGGGGAFAGAGGGGGSSFIQAGSTETSFAVNTEEAAAGITVTYAGGTETIVFNASSSEQSFVIPIGVSRVKIVATGANGFDQCGCGAGSGLKVTAALAVKHGQKYFIDFVGGGNGSGSGGNAADLRTIPRAEAGSLASRLVVAGGGGGSGTTEELTNGGIGGNAGFTEGGTGGSSLAGNGGHGGTHSAGGAGGAGTVNGQTGSLGQGGNGGSNIEGTGGGGGGGYYGGGGGAGGAGATAGGGGGSSFVVAGAEEVSTGTTGSKEAANLEIIYKSASPPSVSLTTPSEGARYSVGQSVAASYSCAEGTGGPGLLPGSEGCSGSVANGAAINTSTAGEHAFTVIATSGDGLTSSTTVKFFVAQPPKASITTPAEGAKYNHGQVVDASYSCTEGTGGPGLKPGAEGCSGTVANGTAIETSVAGEHKFTVTATSQDGLTGSKTVTYSVIAPPSALITTPASGGEYLQGATVDASYSCSEAAGGPGLKAGSEGCSGTVANGAAIDTSTLGEHSFSVTANSTDGQSATASVTYIVVAPPVFGRCLTKAKGKFTTGTCTTAASGETGKFEWSPGPGPKPNFTITKKPSTAMALETTNKKTLVCTSATGSGVITGLKKANLFLLFSGCTDGGESCSSNGVEGQVELDFAGTLGWSNKSLKKLDLRLVNIGSITYQCFTGGTLNKFVALSTNGILLPVTVNAMTAKPTDTFSEKNGKQVPSGLEGEPPFVTEEFRYENPKEETVGAGLKATLLQTDEERNEINIDF